MMENYGHYYYRWNNLRLHYSTIGNSMKIEQHFFLHEQCRQKLCDKSCKNPINVYQKKFFLIKQSKFKFISKTNN